MQGMLQSDMDHQSACERLQVENFTVCGNGPFDGNSPPPHSYERPPPPFNRQQRGLGSQQRPSSAPPEHAPLPRSSQDMQQERQQLQEQQVRSDQDDWCVAARAVMRQHGYTFEPQPEPQVVRSSAPAADPHEHAKRDGQTQGQEPQQRRRLSKDSASAPPSAHGSTGGRRSIRVRRPSPRLSPHRPKAASLPLARQSGSQDTNSDASESAELGRVIVGLQDEIASLELRQQQCKQRKVQPSEQDQQQQKQQQWKAQQQAQQESYSQRRLQLQEMQAQLQREEAAQEQEQAMQARWQAAWPSRAMPAPPFDASAVNSNGLSLPGSKQPGGAPSWQHNSFRSAQVQPEGQMAPEGGCPVLEGFTFDSQDLYDASGLALDMKADLSPLSGLRDMQEGCYRGAGGFSFAEMDRQAQASHAWRGGQAAAADGNQLEGRIWRAL